VTDIIDAIIVRYKRGDAIADPTQLSNTIGQHLNDFAKLERDAQKLQQLTSEIKAIRARDANSEEQKPLWNEVFSMERVFREMLGLSAYRYYVWFRDIWDLTLAILQQFSLPTALRRKVEQVSRYWASKQKSKNIRLRGNPLDQYDAAATNYLRQLSEIRGQHAVILEALSKGKPLDESHKIKAGPFSLVNTGGFNEAIMSAAAETVQKAATLITSKGFGKVCYGNVQVSRKVGKSNVLAFYLHSSDEIFVRAGIRVSVDTLQVVLHELFHRLQRKFLSGKDRKIDELYRKCRRASESVEDAKRERLPVPSKGDEIVYKGEALVVRMVDLRSRTVHLVLKDEAPKFILKVPIETYAKNYLGVTTDDIVGDKSSGFVTQYASKNPEENFCEMGSFYCLNKLSEEQVADFEEVLK
jgi:hypothetical protein